MLVPVTCLAERGSAVHRSATPPDTIGSGKVVLLDCFFNNEWKKDAAGHPYRFHYIWSDTANSGFSMLGAIIQRLGASIDTLCQAPTVERLERSDIYIVVDPDTPKETESPHVIDDESLGAIVRWVRGGGTLVLMGNDKGNAEFEHWNQLAMRFGIQFNEDSRNRVTGDKFEDGSFSTFPDHPLFKGVRKIFIKELSTLRLLQPATAVLTDGNDIIMAYSTVGRGSVFAVGDPWFYNEYMDNRKLPDGFDNARAAENLFRWLLQRVPAR